jgi:enoyl-CoA hydratase/carnithine racemase
LSGQVHIERPSPGVVLLTLDSPPLNALGPEMLATIIGVLDQVEADDALRCLVLTGAGRAFCTGADLKASGGVAAGAFGTMLDRVASTRVAVIAAVNGHCIGGGFELALSCDIRLAATTASFTAAGVNMGLMASAYSLPRLIGVARAKAILLTGQPCDARTAEQYGVVTGLLDPTELTDAALTLAARIASRAPLSVEATKRIASRAPDLSPEDAGTMQSKELRVLSRSEDHREAVAAFREKRNPSFQRR